MVSRGPGRIRANGIGELTEIWVEKGLLAIVAREMGKFKSEITKNGSKSMAEYFRNCIPFSISAVI